MPARHAHQNLPRAAATPRSLPLAQDILDAMEGVCYLVGFDGEILAIGQPHWEAVAAEGGNPGPRAQDLAGSNIFAHMAGADVQAVYHRHLQDIATGRAPEISFEFRCDAPAIRGEMRMCMSAIRDAGGRKAALLQSVVIAEARRPRINLFDSTVQLQWQAEQRALPLVTLCSYCHDLKTDTPDAGWQSAESYYRQGGAERVRISHGMCPACFARQQRPPRPWRAWRRRQRTITVRQGAPGRSGSGRPGGTLQRPG